MRHDRFQSFLGGQMMLVALLGAALGLFLRFPSLRTPYDLPELHLVFATVFTLGGVLIALLAGARFGVDGRRFDLLLGAGFLVLSLSWLAFTVAPGLGNATARLAGDGGHALGWALIAAAPFAHGRVERRRRTLLVTLALSVAVLLPTWSLTHAGPEAASAMLALQAFFQLCAAVGFGFRYRARGEDLDQWLSVAALLMVFASLGAIFAPSASAPEVARADFLVLIAQCVLLVGLWRAILASEFGRAVGDERARVAREIHDGLAQYLFTISTCASMLEAGADPATTLPRLKEAALAAQQEARYAILALSSAAGRAPFDTALHRYVDLLAADGALEVSLEIGSAVSLGPDEQIEIFRIVQEGLANARKHAGARHAWVRIWEDAGHRHVTVRDDGEGFEPETEDVGQGLRNMRERSASIGGAFSLRSAPGRGTSLDVVLRA